MHINDLLLQAVRTTVDLQVFFSLPPCQTVHAKQISILCLYHMFFGRVAVGGAKIDEIGRILDRGRYGYEFRSAFCPPWTTETQCMTYTCVYLAPSFVVAR